MQYPGKAKKNYSKNISYANRGMNLESLINDTNKFYEEHNIAIIYKKPTPITISNVDYESNKKVLTKGYFKSKSTLDYVGIYKGRYIDFDTKSSLLKTAFPLKNIHQHQIKHIENIINHGGISFLIIEINNQIYLFKGEDLITFLKTSSRKSIPFEHIKSVGYEIKIGYCPVIDYIKVINKIYFQEDKNEK